MEAGEQQKMNFADLIERIVPLIAKLFATCALHDPVRMRFADLGARTLVELVELMKREGVSDEVLAASVEMRVSGFRGKMRRLRQNQADHAPAEAGTLIEKVYRFIERKHLENDRPTLFEDVEGRFHGQTGDALNAVLKFLVDSGYLSVSGRGGKRRFRIEPIHQPSRDPLPSIAILLYRDGPLTAQQLASRLSLEMDDCLDALKTLEDAGHLEVSQDTPPTYKTTYYHLPFGVSAGYEETLYDHVKAVVDSLCAKIEAGTYDAQLGQLIGGTTYSFDVPVDDDLYPEISGFLDRMRKLMPEWLEKVEPHLTDKDPNRRYRRITLYTGQMVEELEPAVST